MLQRPALVAALLLSGALAGLPAMAASTATVSVSLDLADLQAGLNGFTGGVQDTPPFTAPFSVVLAAGDTFDFTIDFVGNQTLTINNLSSLWAFSYADLETDVNGTGSLSLLDANGAVLLTSMLKTSTEGSIHFGQTFNASDFASLPSSVTFGGLRYVGTINAYVDATVTERTYDSPALYFTADSFVTSVPEPSSYLLMALGLGGLAAARRRARGEN